MKSLITKIALFAAAMLAVVSTSAPVSADRPHWAGQERIHHIHHSDRRGNWRAERREERRMERRIERRVERRIERRYEQPRRVIHNHRTIEIHRYEPRRSYHRHYSRGYGGGGLDKSTGGTIVGAILGAAVGSQFGSGSGQTAAIAGGAVIGGIVGHEIGRGMEEADRARVQSTLERTPTGQTVAWQNPDTGNQYAVTPTRTYRSAGNRDCREYNTWVFIDGYEEEVKGTACRMPDGRWQMQES